MTSKHYDILAKMGIYRVFDISDWILDITKFTHIRTHTSLHARVHDNCDKHPYLTKAIHAALVSELIRLSIDA